jgi:uncharacterized delta-60 repeat protein
MKAKPALTFLLLLAATGAMPAGASALGRAGDVDPTFNGGRPVLADLAKTIPRVTYFGNVMADDAGRLLTAGTTSDADGHTAVAIARFGADGTLDAGFGEGGSRVMQLSTGTNAYSSPSALFPVPGRYAGFGVYRFVNQRPIQSAFEIRADGSPDLDVGSGGLAAYDPATPPATANTSSATAGPDGSLYVSGVLEQNPMTGANRKLALTRFTPQGLLAAGFGTNNGTYINTFSQYPSDTGTYGGPVRALPNGKLLLAGVALLPSSRFGVLLARFNAQSGAIDTTFGTMAGHTLTNASDPSDPSADSQPSDMAIGPDGEIYVGGTADDASDNQVAMVARYTPGGVLDPTFGVGGVKRLQLGGVDERSGISKIALQADGKIVAVASVSPQGGGSSTSRLVRFRYDGSLDPAFGNAGVVTPTLGGTGGGVGSATIVGGRLVVAGYVVDGARTYGAISRYLLDALPDPPPAGPTPPGAPPAGPGPGPGAGGGGPQPTPVSKVGFTAKRLSVDAKGRVRVPLTCSAAAACAGRLTLVSSTGRVAIPAAKRAKTYASAKYRLAKATNKTITLTLTKSARAQARRKKGLKARLAISPAGASTKTYTITLSRPRSR